MININVVENFITTDVCERYVDIISRTNWWEPAHVAFWNDRSINLHSMPSGIREELLDLRLIIKQKMMIDYNCVDDLYSDIFQFVRWQEECELPPHADAENANGDPHVVFYRKYASVIYLNDKYNGGQIYFPNFDNYAPSIKPGTLVMFPSTLRYLHGVTKITTGTRYTITGFFTHNHTYKDEYRI